MQGLYNLHLGDLIQVCTWHQIEQKSLWSTLEVEVRDVALENPLPATSRNATSPADAWRMSSSEPKGKCVEQKLLNEVFAYFDGSVYNSHSLSRGLLCFDRFTQSNKSQQVIISCFEYVILKT